MVMRRILAVLHRWFGLFTALFLLVAGLTGALIAWDHELDAWLNPQLFHVHGSAAALPSTELARRLEAADPRLRVSYLPLAVEPGHALSMFVMPRLDPTTKQPYQLGFSEVMVDPSSGRVLGQREWGAFSLARKNLVPFLYKLHYTLHVPDVGLFRPGVVFMGIVALVWLLDAFVALYIAFPNRKVWKKSFALRLRSGSHKLTFDLHRSGGVWLWPILLVFAFTALSMNLDHELVRPVVGWFSPLTPSPFEAELPATPPETRITREQAIERALVYAKQLGIQEPAGGVFHAAQLGFYGVGFHRPGNGHGDGGLGTPQLYIDGQTGALKAKTLPGEGSAGDVFMQAQFPLHSGRIFGVAGRVIVTALGLLIAMLSFTGVWLWAKKRVAWGRARARSNATDSAPSAVPGE